MSWTVYTCWEVDAWDAFIPRRPLSGRCLYVGMTVDWEQRQHRHNRESAWYPRASWFRFIRPLPTEDTARALEAYLIWHLRPIFNKHKPWHGPWAALWVRQRWSQYALARILDENEQEHDELVPGQEVMPALADLDGDRFVVQDLDELHEQRIDEALDWNDRCLKWIELDVWDWECVVPVWDMDDPAEPSGPSEQVA